MDQVYWISHPIEAGTDTRNLVYRYGRFCYAGSVITESIYGLEYLPGMLQGIQAVQGQIPYLAEHKDLDPGSPTQLSLAYLERAMTVIYNELTSHDDKLASLAKQGNKWLDDDDAAVYFEFEALPGYSCDGSDVVFAKTFRGEVMLTVIWYGIGAGRGGGGSFFVTLTPAGGAEQALVDTLFPQIYGKRRGAEVHSYTANAAYTLKHDAAFAQLAAKGGGSGGASLAEDGKEAEEGSGGLLDPCTLFVRMSVWEASDEVPDPDAIRARDEEEEGLDIEREEEESGDEGAPQGGEDVGPTVDVSGGEGYTQVYAIMQPPPVRSASNRTTLPDGTTLVPRLAAFRFGSWVYAGQVDFAVENVRLGDVPFVLPAVQKQQGRLGYLSEASAVPASHPMCQVLQAFMGAMGILKHEMEDAQEEVAALAEQSVNAWIDEEWAASFFELSFVPTSIKGAHAEGASSGEGLAGAEVIAAKVYLFGGTGVVLHCVWYGSSLFCVLADSVEDLPLLDVAFPDVTARNRVVQVRSYEDRTAAKLADAWPGAPLPRALRVWEGRRKGVPGVGHGAAAAISSAGSEGDELRAKATAKAAKEQVSAGIGLPAGKGKAAGTVSDGKACEGDAGKEEDDLYDLGSMKQSLQGQGSGSGAGIGRDAAGNGAGAAPSKPQAASAEPTAASFPSQLMQSSASLARAPHHVAPLNNASGGRARASVETSVGEGAGSTLFSTIAVAPANYSTGMDSASKEGEAPWDALGRPRGK